jgi:hypothetical protein
VSEKRDVFQSASFALGDLSGADFNRPDFDQKLDAAVAALARTMSIDPVLVARELLRAAERATIANLADAFGDIAEGSTP